MPCPIISIAQMREWEKATWAGGQTEAEVIRRVGESVARHAMRLTRAMELVLILAGKGHNGEDARCAHDHLRERKVDILDVSDPKADLSRLEALLSLRPALVIDGLFGIGINRPLSVEWVKFIECLNAAHTQVLAVDVPSGLNADTGQPEGAAVRATVTLTVGAPKRGLLQESAWPFVGRLEVTEDVGLVPCPMRSELQWTVPEDFAAYPPRRATAAHKGSYGHLAIIAGSLGYHGAAVLAARGAQRAQPGLVTLFTLETVYPSIASQLEAVMVSPLRVKGRGRQASSMVSPTLDAYAARQAGGRQGGREPALRACLPGPWTGILVGPGLAATDVPEALKELTRSLWLSSPLPMVVDASALDWLPREATPATAARVITPHPGEAGRLLSVSPKQVQAARVASLRALSKRFGHAWVVLKGHETLIGRSTGAVFVNSSGNPHLAQGGSGDVLSGLIAGLLAQPALQEDVSKTLRYAAWRHGAAADHLQEVRPGWVVEELVGAL